MKVQFMKKLVPLALITSIAVTNIGITSVAAQTPEVAVAQSVEGAPIVGEDGENETVDYPAAAPEMTNGQTVKAEYVAGAGDTDTATVELTFTDLKEATAEVLKVVSGGSDVEDIEITVADNKITLTIPKSAFGTTAAGTTLDWTIQYATAANTWSAVDNGTFKISWTETAAPVVPATIDGKTGEFTLPAGQDFKLTLAANGIKDAAGTELVAIGKDAGGADYVLPQKTATAGTKDDLTNDEKNELKTLAQTETAAYETTYKNTEAAKVTDVLDAATALYLDDLFTNKLSDVIGLADGLLENDEQKVKVSLKNADVLDGSYAKITDDSAYSAAVQALLTKACHAESTSTASKTYAEAILGQFTSYLTNEKKAAILDAAEKANSPTALQTAYITEFNEAKGAVSTEGTEYQNALKAYVGTEANFYTDATDTSSPVYTKAQELMAKHTVTAGVDESAIKWVAEEVTVKNGVTTRKASGNAKFSGKATATGTEVTINKTKAAGKFNSTIVIRAVGKNYDTKKTNTTGYEYKETTGTDGTVTSDTRIFAEFKLYVTPSVPTEWKEVKNLDKLGMTSVSTVTEGYDQEYNMKLAEGKSAKLPFAPKDGGDKTMVYEIQEDAMGFQVVNGAVKALAGGGSGDIVCYPTASPDKKILVHVTTESAIKSIRANTTKVTVYPHSTQTIYLGTVPASFDTTYDVGGNASGTVDGVCTWEIVGNKLTITAANGVAKGAKGTLEVKTGSVKPLKITLTGADAPLNAKALKLSTKKTNADGLIEVNVPVGTAYNLGIAMNPATADANMTVADRSANYPGATAIDTEVDVPVVQKAEDTPTNPPAENPETPEQPSSEENTAEENSASAPMVSADGDVEQDDEEETSNTVKKDALEVSGDVIKGNGVGIYYIQYTSEAAGADGSTLTTPVYKINVYTPGSTVVVEDDCTVVGGFLMTDEAAQTNCDKTFYVGQTKTFTVKTAGDVSEPIEWKCNKEGAVDITYDYAHDEVELTPYQTGTFTVTGTTKYTKQKIAFKVLAVNDTSDKNDTTYDARVAAAKANQTAAGIKFQYYDETNGTWEDAAPANVKVKDKVKVRVVTNEIGGVVKMKVADASKAVGSLGGNGLFTAKSAGTASLTAEMTVTKADGKTKETITVPAGSITVGAQTPTFTKVTVPVGVVKGTEAKFAAAVKNVKPADATVEWTATKSGGTAQELGKTLNGKFAVNLEPGEYKVVCKVNDVVSVEQDMTVYASDQAIKSATTNYTFAEYSDELATAADVDKAEAVADDAAKTKKNQTAALKAINNAYKTAINNLKGKKEGQGAAYGTYYIPIFATPVTDGSTLTKAGVDDIVWTSSNVNLATADTVTTLGTDGLEGGLVDQAASAAYAIAKITTNAAADTNGYTGQVTLTGLLKNSGKKVTVTLMLNGETGDANASSDAPEVEVIEHVESAAIDFGIGENEVIPSVSAADGLKIDDDAITNVRFGLVAADKLDAVLAATSTSDDFKTVINSSTKKLLNSAYDGLTDGTKYYYVAEVITKKVTEDGTLPTAGGESTLSYQKIGTKGFTAKKVDAAEVVLTGTDEVEVTITGTPDVGATYKVVNAAGNEQAGFAFAVTDGKLMISHTQNAVMNGMLVYITDGTNKVSGPIWLSATAAN